jgi:hypothetical protein
MMLGVGQLRDFATHYTAAWCSGDPARVAACYAPNGSLTINDGAPSSGRIEILEAALGFRSTFPDLRVIMDDVLVKDKYAEFHWTLTGTNSGAGGTGNRVRISGGWSRCGIAGHFDSEKYETSAERRAVGTGVSVVLVGAVGAELTGDWDRVLSCFKRSGSSIEVLRSAQDDNMGDS